MLNVLESWGVDHIYGIPGGSFNSIMNAMYDKRDSIKFIQVRHEETGAIAAAVDAKLTGKIGVCFGTAGPGATHLFNGLYDAQMDHVPVLALVGQSSSRLMNYDYFQEMNENPMFADVSVYNRTVMNPESLPYMVDDAIRKAHERKGVAVITIPVDYGYSDIPDTGVSSALNFHARFQMPDPADIKKAAELIAQAERPILFVGQGANGARDEIVALSNRYSLPIIESVLAKGLVPEDAENFLGTVWRLSTKPANEALAMTDLIVFVGSDFPFAKPAFPASAKMIQVDTDPAKLGKRHKTDVAILGDAKETMKQLAAAGPKIAAGRWLAANRENRRNWLKWIAGFENSTDKPMRVEPVFKEINRIAKDDAIFVTDVGNVTIHAVRFLNMPGGKERFTTSGLFATMGYGVPGGIAARLSYPERQVFTLSGDGGFAMVMQDIITQVKYKLPIINIVLANDSFGFIEGEQEDTNQPKYGIDLQGADYGKAAEAMGALGFTVTDPKDLAHVFDEAAKSDRPVVIDVKITGARPFPAENMILDADRFTAEEIASFKKRYEVRDMPLLKELLK